MKYPLIKGILPLCLVLTAAVSGCAAPDSMDLKDMAIEHETELGGAYIRITTQEFLERGFQFGDSVLAEFSNGYVLEDLPFYNGYYVPLEEPLLVGYPGYPYIKAVFNSDDDLWEIAKLKETDTASVSLYEKRKVSLCHAGKRSGTGD